MHAGVPKAQRMKYNYFSYMMHINSHLWEQRKLKSVYRLQLWSVANPSASKPWVPPRGIFQG